MLDFHLGFIAVLLEILRFGRLNLPELFFDFLRFPAIAEVGEFFREDLRGQFLDSGADILSFDVVVTIIQFFEQIIESVL